MECGDQHGHHVWDSLVEHPAQFPDVPLMLAILCLFVGHRS